jgi:hypothetical protein
MNSEIYENLVECSYDYLSKYDEKKLKTDMISAIKDAQKTIAEEDDEEESEDE